MNTIKIGEKEVQLEDISHDWAIALMARGVIVELNLHLWRGSTKLTHSELGINYVDDETKDFMSKYITLGSEKLIPPQIRRELIQLEKMARDNLKIHSFQTIWGSFVPYNAFEHWYEENERIKRIFYEYVLAFIAKRNEVVSMVATEFRTLAKDVWRRNNPTGGDAPESYITQFTDNIVAKIPSSTELAALFKYETVFFNIPLPTLIQQNIENAKEIERETAKKDFDAETEKRAKLIISQEYVTKKKELIDGFLDATVKSIRKTVEDLCLDVLESLGKEKAKDISLIQQSRVIAVIERVNLLNFHNDKEIEKMLAELRFETMKVKGERDKDVIVATLQRIAKTASEEFVPEGFNPAVDYLEV